MTDEDRLLLNDLKANTVQLFSIFEQLEKEKKQLEEIILSLKHDVDKLMQEKTDLSQTHEQLKVASQILTSEGETREAKQRINKLVREIDKCIALLNK